MEEVNGKPIMNQTIGKEAGASPWAKDLNAITLFVEDLEAAKQFYRRLQHHDQRICR